ncbi:TPA: CD1107 family mobile element protein [Streptococcus suis]
MKTSLKKNNKFWTAALAVIVSISCILGLWTVVYAKEQKGADTPTSDKAVQTEVEVNVKYIFEDEKVFKEEKIKAEKGQFLDSGDLPMLPDNMKFIDEFLFYEVKGDGNDEIIRKVAKIEIKDTQTEEEKPKQDESTQTETPKTEDKGTQTELSKEDISKMEKEAKELQEKLDKLNGEIKDKDKLSDKQKEKIKDLENEIDSLKEKAKKDKGNKVISEDMKKEMDKLSEKVKELEKKAAETNKAPVTSQSVTPISPISEIKTSSGIPSQTPQTSISSSGKGSSDTVSSGNTTKDTGKTEAKEKEKEVRYPNKLTAKAPANSNSQDSSMEGASSNVNTNKGVASSASKARGTVTENKDNANKDYPIHHGDSSDNKETDQYSADARQFITFQTKNGKTFHLIINHDEDSENVMLLTEVSEDDLLNMVEKKEAPKQEVVKEEPVKEEVKPEKKEEKSSLGTYIILLLVVGGALGVGYYFKVVKKKEDRELEALEEEDDDFFSEAESEEEPNDVDEVEAEDEQ